MVARKNRDPRRGPFRGTASKQRPVSETVKKVKKKSPRKKDTNAQSDKKPDTAQEQKPVTATDDNVSNK